MYSVFRSSVQSALGSVAAGPQRRRYHPYLEEKILGGDALLDALHVVSRELIGAGGELHQQPFEFVEECRHRAVAGPGHRLPIEAIGRDEFLGSFAFERDVHRIPAIRLFLADQLDQHRL